MADEEGQSPPTPMEPTEGGESEAPPPAESAPAETTEAAAPSEDASAQSPQSPEASPAPATRKKHRKKGDLQLEHARIGFLGAGKMTESIVDGLMAHGNIPSRHIFVAAPSKKNLQHFKDKGCHASRRLIDIFAKYDCDVIFLCFHGSVVKNAFKQGGSRPFPITTNYIPNQKHPIYILSCVSGVTLDEIKECLLNPEHPDRYILEMHRIMVNTASSVGQGLVAVDVEPDSNKLTNPIRTLLQSLTPESQNIRLEYVPEGQMDAACAVGGSGLAFSYYFISALADGAFKCGLTRPLSLKFASKTALCAAQVMIESGKHPSELRDDAVAPGGSAIYGIHILDRAEVASGITAAVEAAYRRAEELSQAD